MAKEHDGIDKKNEVVSVDENEQKLEEEKAAEDPTSNAKDVSSGEVSFHVIIGLTSI